MENKTITTENPAEQTTQTTQTQAIEQASGRKKVYRDQDFFPVCAIIMCACAAVGHLIGTYVLNDAQMGSGIGMGVGIVLAILFLKKGGKQVDTSPTKEKNAKKN